jgi:hypothetical protein
VQKSWGILWDIQLVCQLVDYWKAWLLVAMKACLSVVELAAQKVIEWADQKVELSAVLLAL